MGRKTDTREVDKSKGGSRKVGITKSEAHPLSDM